MFNLHVLHKIRMGVQTAFWMITNNKIGWRFTVKYFSCRLKRNINHPSSRSLIRSSRIVKHLPGQLSWKTRISGRWKGFHPLFPPLSAWRYRTFKSEMNRNNYDMRVLLHLSQLEPSWMQLQVTVKWTEIAMCVTYFIFDIYLTIHLSQLQLCCELNVELFNVSPLNDI